MPRSLVPVILCGGSGSRLWPMSRKLLPKQFLPLVTERSLLQDTALRLRGLKGAGALAGDTIFCTPWEFACHRLH
jgi:mannose-1-phosphate guanylyltransferase